MTARAASRGAWRPRRATKEALPRRRRATRLALAAVLLALPACRAAAVTPAAPGGPAPPDRTLNVAFLVVDGVYNSELVAPYDIFHHVRFHAEPAMEVFTVAPTRAPVTTFEGLVLRPHHDFASCPDVDVLVVPSAEHSMDDDLEDEAMMAFVRERGAAADWCLSLCDGAFVLAAAGLLDGHEATTFPGDLAAFRERFGDTVTVHEDVSFVHDGRMITAAGGARSYDPAMYLVERLYGPRAAAGVGRGMVIDWDPDAIAHVRRPRGR